MADMAVRRRRPARSAAEGEPTGGGAEKAGGSAPPAPEHLAATDGIRAVASVLIALFHGRWWLAQLVRDHEAVATPSSWLLGSLYVVVDVFLALSGYLTARSLLKAPEAAPILAPLRSRAWRVLPPLCVVMAAAAALFWGDRTWPRSYTRSEVNQHYAEAFVPGKEWQTTALASWPAHLVHLSSLVPVGGFLMHGWSVAVQYLCWLLSPVFCRACGLGRGSRLPWLVAALAAVHAALRAWMWTRLATFGAPSPLAKYLQFSFYVSAPARALAFVLGAGVAWMVRRRPGAVRWLRSGAPGALAVRAAGWSCLAASVAVNVVWEHWRGHPGGGGDGADQAAVYVLLHPGGALTSVGWTWLLLAVVADVPLLGAAPDRPADAEPRPGSAAPAATPLTRCLSSRLFAPLSRASYWLYLLHPVLFSVLLPRPHALMPASRLRIPVPVGYGLATTHASYAAASGHPLHPASSPSAAAVTLPSAQQGWVPAEQSHWLVAEAARRGLQEGPPLLAWASAADWAAVLAAAVAASALLAVGLEAAVERPAAALLRRLWAASPAPAWASAGLLDTYHGILILVLPVAHALAHAVWLTQISGDVEPALVDDLRASLANATRHAQAEAVAHAARWRGAVG